AVQDRLRRPGALRLAGGVRAGRRLPAAPDHGGPRPGHPPAPRRRPRDRPAGGDDVGPPPPQRRPRPRARAQLADPAALHPARAAGAARPDVPAGALDDRSVSPVMSWAYATIRSRSATDPPPDHPRSVPPGARDLPINHLALPGPAARETQMVGDSGGNHGPPRQKRGWPVRARPIRSRSTSLVGAITVAARASRKSRSSGRWRENAAPPHTRIVSSVTAIAISAAAAFSASTPSWAAGSPAATWPATSYSSARACMWRILASARRARFTAIPLSGVCRCSSRALARWSAAIATAAPARPAQQAAQPSANQGSVASIISDIPDAAAPSRRDASTRTAANSIALDALPHRPRPSNGPPTSIPGVPAGIR